MSHFISILTRNISFVCNQSYDEILNFELIMINKNFGKKTIGLIEWIWSQIKNLQRLFLYKLQIILLSCTLSWRNDLLGIQT